jgi:hypothetical protein
MNGMKGKIVILILILGGIFIGNVTAGGDVDIDLRCDSPSATIRNSIGNESYSGMAKRYTWSYYEPYYYYGNDGEYTDSTRLSYYGYVDVSYQDVKPYVLREDVFKANPNYYRDGMSGSGSEGWWIFSDSDSADFPPRQYHQYATPTTSKNPAVTDIKYGQIKLTYKRHDGTTGEKIINVQVQRRDCESYNNGTWREVSPGRWEQQ